MQHDMEFSGGCCVGISVQVHSAVVLSAAARNLLSPDRFNSYSKEFVERLRQPIEKLKIR